MDDALLGVGSLAPDDDGNMAQELVVIENVNEFKKMLIEKGAIDNYVHMMRETVKGLQSTIDFLEKPSTK